MKNTSHYRDASHSVMQDLVDCLLAEEFFGPQPLALCTADEWQQQYGQATPFGVLDSTVRLWRWCSDEREQRHLVAALRPGITQRWEKVPGTTVYAWQQGGNDWRELEPESFMKLVFAGQHSEEEIMPKVRRCFWMCLTPALSRPRCRVSTVSTPMSCSHVAMPISFM
ncbi:hypothetical protein [Dickeya poaceiphila]|uniref:hypothetical protein n=1 Tax=Dickeya poaceiphila TaxID=568768 RepID=UPI001F21B9CE|nr:hypothetical protein [Dickeya poaceiphila]